MSNDNEPVSDSIKEVLIAISLLAGCIGGVCIFYLTQTTLLAIPVGIVTAFAHPFIGATVAAICEDFGQWAHEGKGGQWSRDGAAMAGAFWPFTLPYYLIYYTFLGIINRIY